MTKLFRVSNCKTTKEILDILEVTYEGTEEDKRSKLKTLAQEYELFIMLPHESILDLQNIFTHFINHFMALGKTFTNDGLNLKILRSLSRVWQSKVTSISETKSLSKMSLASLFVKLQEHEMKLDSLERHELDHDKLKKHEWGEVKVKSLALRSNHESDE